MRNHYTIATAGHVDHGKTSLIKALTGKDCDTHPQEKLRGITIHLGFSYLKLSEDVNVGIVDVPGHKDFIDTMISGINGIDLVLFIIAADEGFMPQSYEHLQILKVLGVPRGVIVLTKCDLVDEETLFYATEEVKEKTRGSFLENAPIIKTSIFESEYIEKLKALILCELNHPAPGTEDKFLSLLYNLPAPFRYYPDRFFTVKGVGTVVTGTVLSGTFTKKKPLYTLPLNREIKVRKIEVYGEDIETISAGQRASLNLAGFDKDSFQKGMMFCEQTYHTTSLIDTQISLFNVAKHFEIWSTVVFYTATIETQARIHLIDKDRLYSDESAFAQLHLEKAVPLSIGDKFIIRNTSGDITLGGGTIIDAFPLHHRKRTEKVKDLLKMRVSGNMVDFICTEVAKTVKPISFEQIGNKIMKKIEYQDIIESFPEGYLHYGEWLWTEHEKSKLEKRIYRFLQVAHKNNPLENNGKLPEELVSLVAEYPEASKPIVVQNALAAMKDKELVDIREGTFALSKHKVTLTHQDHLNIMWIDQFILNQKMKTPLWSQIMQRAKERNIEEKRLKQMVFYLITRKRIVHFQGEYLHAFIVNPIRQKMLEHLSKNEEGITVAEFRDLIGANRKICLILLNIFDSEGITCRIDDKRFITQKGKATL